MAVAEVGETTFETEVLRSQVPVLVDFWAPWCGPCRTIGPLLHQVAKKYDGRATIAKVNIEQNRALAVRYNVSSIPNLVLFIGGQPVDSVLGAVPILKIERMIDRHLASLSGAPTPSGIRVRGANGKSNPLDAIIQSRGGK